MPHPDGPMKAVTCRWGISMLILIEGLLLAVVKVEVANLQKIGPGLGPIPMLRLFLARTRLAAVADPWF